MTRFPGGYFRAADGAVDVAIATAGPVLIRLSGEHLAALTAACLKAFREGGGELHRQFKPDVCNKAADRRSRQNVLLRSLAEAWRTEPANDVERAARVTCALQLEKVLAGLLPRLTPEEREAGAR